MKNQPNAPTTPKLSKEVQPKTPEEQVKDFIAEFDLESALPPEFKNLKEGQQLKVVQALKHRIVDLVKSDAQTQYSEDLKEKGKIATIRASLNKESGLKTFEAKAFTAIRDTDEGKKLIAENLAQLTEMTRGVDVSVVNGKPEIIFFNPDDFADPIEKSSIVAFNMAANKFREVPDEWGQEAQKGSKWNPEIIKGNRTKYEQAKKEYEDARNEVLEIEKKKNGEKVALTNMLILDNMVQMEQLINTHPEFEAELIRLSKDTSIMAQAKDAWNLGGKGRNNKFIFAGGFAARTLVRGTALFSSTSIVTWLAASTIGAVVGGIKGRIKGKETLTERQQQARHGQKDTSKERVATTDVTHLNKRLEDLIKEIENPSATTRAAEEFEVETESGTISKKKIEGKTSSAEENQAKALSMLAARIEHTRGKIEEGQVNYGDAKSELVNQFNLLKTLNKALVLQETMSGKNNAELKKRIDGLLSIQGENIAEKTSEAQRKFKNKQMLKGAAIGATAATAGYVVRWLGDHVSGWMREHVAVATNPNAGSTLKTLRHDGVKLHGTHPKLGDMSVKGGQGIMTPEEAAAKIAKMTPAEAEAQRAFNAGAGITKAINLAPGTGHEISHDFSVKLGEGGVPKNLETVYNEISADHMSVPTSGTIDEQFATKSLNMAANLVRLTEHHNVAGISADDFAKVASFKDGVLQIKNPAGFNEIVAKLQAHSDELWKKGILQGDGAAITQIPKISPGNWLKIMHADGMHEGTALDGTQHTATGIIGHQEVDAKHITNFSDSEMVKHATQHGHESEIANAKAKLMEHMDGKITTEDAEEARPDEKLLEALKRDGFTGNPKDGKAVEAFYKTKGEELETSGTDRVGRYDDDTLSDERHSDGSEAWRERPIDWHDKKIERFVGDNPAKLTGSQMLKAYDAHNSNIEIFRHDESGIAAWNKIKVSSANKLLGQEYHRENRLAYYIHTLRDMTGLIPRSGVLGIGRENVEHYLARALQEVTKLGRLDEVNASLRKS